MPNQANTPQKTRIGWVLRDMMQSTGIWTFDGETIASLALTASECGFSHMEMGGGQSFQIALQNSTSPYQRLRLIKKALDKNAAALPLQVLLRGANQFGFHHFAHSVQKKNLDLLIDAGGDSDKSRALVIRIFDALNDVENLRFCIEYLVKNNVAAKAGGKKLVSVQAALSYVAPVSSDKNALYSKEYYVAYARKLRKVAQDAGGDLDSLCIKDMSGQLTASAARDLVPALHELGLPVVLHCHSTDEAKSLAAILSAVEVGVDAIEVALHPLAGGASHHDARHLLPFEGVTRLDHNKLAELESRCMELFADRVQERKDYSLPIGCLKRLAGLGIPGGAIPFIVHDLQEQVCATLGMDLDQAIDAFSEELARLQVQLGRVPLVTPTADIIAKQVIKNLGNQVRAEKYQLVDPRFCSLVLGYYGDVVNHATGEKIAIDKTLVEYVIRYCEAIEPDFDGRRVKAGKVYPEPAVCKQHPSLNVDDRELEEAERYVNELASRYPESVERFSTVEECVMMQVMRPAGNNERLLTRNILGPTADRLRLLLDKTLHLLPARKIPEAREQLHNETTDLALLDRLGDYEGIISHIKDLVMHVEYADLESRLESLKNKIVGSYCEENQAAKGNRLYVERRFVALFAAALFWDLQRICRRTGADSREGLDESTANSLGRIISVTLRKRKQSGKGQSDSYLV